MDKEKGNGNTVLLTVIGVATLLVALVGATFAYFSATITSTAKESIYITTVNPIALKYVGSSAIKLENIAPGESGTSTFTVENATTAEEGATGVVQTYDLHLIVEENGLVNKSTDDSTGTEQTADNQLVVTVTGAVTTAGHAKNDTTDTANTIKALATGTTVGLAGTEAGVYDLTDGTTAAAAGKDYLLLDDQEILVGGKHTYTVTVDFRNNNLNQNVNKGKTFKARFEVNDPKSVNK